jgi:hypothetical protein
MGPDEAGATQVWRPEWFCDYSLKHFANSGDVKLALCVRPSLAPQKGALFRRFD